MNKPQKKICCTPIARGKTPAPQSTLHASADDNRFEGTVTVPGGVPIVGTSRPLIMNDGEEKRPAKTVKSFRIGSTAVTNKQFQKFIEETGYVTDAERLGWSFVFWNQVPEGIENPLGVEGIEWWRRVEGANWRDINGPGSRKSSWFPDHPVVQVSWNDSRAYAHWVGGRLPTEVEWEHAARGGLADVRYPWGEQDPDDRDFMPCNIWQGEFPYRNTGADGYLATAPANSFEANGYGLFNAVGNTWEWTADPYRIPSLKKAVREKLRRMPGFRLLKGGSYLCHASYCWRYRIAARSGNSKDSTTTHQGFRVVFDL
ncbi:MAG: formylglycine-generating enzyme family protein [Pseudomonadota bacterium]